MNFAGITVEEYLEEIASRKASPGGGSASALTAAIGSSLNLMVINFAIKPSKSRDEICELTALKDRQDRVMRRAIRLIDDDCKVFEDLMSSISQKTATDEKYADAAAVPMDICRSARESVSIASQVLDLVKGFITSDIDCSRHILLAAFYAAKVNVEINIREIRSADLRGKLMLELNHLREGIERDADVISGKLGAKPGTKGES